jgi:hypothetical protein
MLIIMIVQGYPEIALQVSLTMFGRVTGSRKLTVTQFVTDPSTRFSLAIECGNLEEATEMGTYPI